MCKYRFFFLLFSCLSLSVPLDAQVVYHQSDSLRVEALLRGSASYPDTQARFLYFADALRKTPYVSNTLESDKELLTVNLRQLDCVTFVENVLALTVAVTRGAHWYDFVDALRSIRYRGGKVDGYASRLHYFTEWIYENSHTNGWVEETTGSLVHASLVRPRVFSFMSKHASAYPSLQRDSVQLRRICETEQWLSRMPIACLMKEQPDFYTQVDRIEPGSIIAFATRTEGLDVTHVGIVVRQDNRLRLLHASSVRKEVVLEPGTLSDYLLRQKYVSGIRVLRLSLP